MDRNDTTGSRPRAADNSGQNEVDRHDGSLTSFDQGTSDADVETTRRIRQSITDAQDLSINARNIKVITRNGVTVLRGPVNSIEERQRLLELARQVESAQRVEDQLAVQVPQK